MARFYRRWTATDDAIALQMKAEHKTLAEISERIRHSKGSIQKRISQLEGRKGSQWNYTEDEMLLDLLHKGYNDEEIGKAIGRTAISVQSRKVLLKKGIRNRGPKYYGEDRTQRQDVKEMSCGLIMDGNSEEWLSENCYFTENEVREMLETCKKDGTWKLVEARRSAMRDESIMRGTVSYSSSACKL